MVKEMNYGTDYRCAEVFKRNGLGDCTNNGISSKRDKLYIVADDITLEDVKALCEKRNDLTVDDFICMEYRVCCGKPYKNFIPLKYKADKTWTMFGGNYIDIDSITKDRFGLDDTRPLSLHDRVETPQQSNLLSV